MGQDDKGLLKTQLPGYVSISEVIGSYEAIHEEAPDTLSDKYIHFFKRNYLMVNYHLILPKLIIRRLL